MSLKRVSRGDQPIVSGEVWPHGDIDVKKFPDLFAFLSERAWPDGEARVTGTLLIFLDAETLMLKCCVKDRDQDRQCFVSGDTLKQLLERAEGVASGEKGDWRASKHDRDRRGPRRS